VKTAAECLDKTRDKHLGIAVFGTISELHFDNFSVLTS
jgi:hypothetical protein